MKICFNFFNSLSFSVCDFFNFRFIETKRQQKYADTHTFTRTQFTLWTVTIVMVEGGAELHITYVCMYVDLIYIHTIFIYIFFFETFFFSLHSSLAYEFCAMKLAWMLLIHCINCMHMRDTLNETKWMNRICHIIEELGLERALSNLCRHLRCFNLFIFCNTTKNTCEVGSLFT